jgi:hypothetical protein
MVRRFAALILLGACSSAKTGEFDRYAGQIYTYECKNTTAPCYHLANERCRKGYSVVNNVETEKTGGVWGRYRAYSITIRCN